jgi:hypothetical protein
MTAGVPVPALKIYANVNDDLKSNTFQHAAKHVGNQADFTGQTSGNG